MCVHRAWESSLPTKHMKVSECMVHRAWESSLPTKHMKVSECMGAFFKGAFLEDGSL